MDNLTFSFHISTITIIITIILTLTTIPATLCRRSDEFNACSKTFTCGNMTGLSYPFYGLSRPQYCGHPGFELLDCDQNTQRNKIMILSQKFYVSHINLTSSTMNVARQDFSDGFGCPLALVNITIDFSLFQYTNSDSNITLIYDECASKCPSFPCPWGEAKSLPICFLTDKLMLKFNMSKVVCPNKLFLPVHNTDVLATDEAGVYRPLSAWNGFELKWNANDGLCRQCVGSGGQCGHDSKSNKFFCFCTDESKCPFPGMFVNNVKWESVSYKLGISDEGTCCICGNSEETMEHLFFDCPYSKRLILQIGGWLGINLPANNWISWRLRRNGSQVQKGILDAAINACIYYVWHQRNRSRYDLMLIRPHKIARMIKEELQLRIRGLDRRRLNRRDENWIQELLSNGN